MTQYDHFSTKHSAPHKSYFYADFDIPGRSGACQEFLILFHRSRGEEFQIEIFQKGSAKLKLSEKLFIYSHNKSTRDDKNVRNNDVTS